MELSDGEIKSLLWYLGIHQIVFNSIFFYLVLWAGFESDWSPRRSFSQQPWYKKLRSGVEIQHQHQQEMGSLSTNSSLCLFLSIWGLGCWHRYPMTWNSTKWRSGCNLLQRCILSSMIRLLKFLSMGSHQISGMNDLLSVGGNILWQYDRVLARMTL